MKKLLLLVCFALVVSAATSFPSVAASDESLAIEAAESFLAIMDDGDFEKGFDSMSEIHKAVWVKEWWLKLHGGQRSFYGTLINRSPKYVKAKDSISMHPDGEYFSLSYESSFQNKKKAFEHVQVMYVKDKGWFVTGYNCN